MRYCVTLLLTLMLVACNAPTGSTTPPGPLSMILIDNPPADDLSRGTFSTALKQASVADVRQLLREDGPFTVFVPTNAAFEAYLEARGITQAAFMKSSELPKFVRSYIAPGNYYPKVLFDTDDLFFNNLNGDPLTITRQGDAFYVNDVLIDGPLLENQKKQEDGVVYFLPNVIALPKVTVP